MEEKNKLKSVGAALKACFPLVRAVFLFCIVVVAVLSVFLIWMAYRVTITQYEETLVWENTAYTVPLADIEPVLVSNVVDTDVVTAAASWERLDAYVDSLSGRIPDRAEAEQILSEAVMWQAAYGLNSLSIDRLRLYLDLEDAVTEAYETLDTENLERLSVELSNLEREDLTTSGQYYQEYIRQVYSDFQTAKTLMEETVGSVGTFEDGVWTLPYTYTSTELNEIASQLSTLEKFPLLCSVDDLSYQLTEILRYNENAREYLTYHAFLGKVEVSSRSDYVQVSSITTYEDAVSFGCIIRLDERDGFTVSPLSLVESLSYRGELLDGDEYVKRGTPLTAQIDEVYDPVLDNSSTDSQAADPGNQILDNQTPEVQNPVTETPNQGNASQETGNQGTQNPNQGTENQGSQNQEPEDPDPIEDPDDGEFDLDNIKNESEE